MQRVMSTQKLPIVADYGVRTRTMAMATASHRRRDELLDVRAPICEK